MMYGINYMTVNRVMCYLRDRAILPGSDLGINDRDFVSVGLV